MKNYIAPVLVLIVLLGLNFLTYQFIDELKGMTAGLLFMAGIIVLNIATTVFFLIQTFSEIQKGIEET